MNRYQDAYTAAYRTLEGRRWCCLYELTAITTRDENEKNEMRISRRSQTSDLPVDDGLELLT
jgi:hypothetical protein